MHCLRYTTKCPINRETSGLRQGNLHTIHRFRKACSIANGLQTKILDFLYQGKEFLQEIDGFPTVNRYPLELHLATVIVTVEQT